MGSPFDSGKALVFKSMSTAGSKRYLNSDPSQPSSTSAYLTESLGFGNGCYWESYKQSDGTYHLKIQVTAGKCYLDSSSVNPPNESVFLNIVDTGGGSLWTPIQHTDGVYSMKSHTPSGPKCYMSANPSAALTDSVYLVDEDSGVATQWQVGIGYFTGKEVENIVSKVYPDISIKFYQADPTYASILDYNLLLTIWKDSGLGTYKWSKEKFDCDDFAICLKGEVAKYSYKKGFLNNSLLCGIMWATNSQGAHAFNFTIDPFGQLILFEPQNGQQILQTEYTPYFCVV